MTGHAVNWHVRICNDLWSLDKSWSTLKPLSKFAIKHFCPWDNTWPNPVLSPGSLTPEAENHWRYYPLTHVICVQSLKKICWRILKLKSAQTDKQKTNRITMTKSILLRKNTLANQLLYWSKFLESYRDSYGIKSQILLQELMKSKNLMAGIMGSQKSKTF